MSAGTENMDDDAHEVESLRVEIWRRMSAQEKFDEVAALNADADRLAEAGVRLRHVDADEREVFLRVAALRNGRELSIAAYGWDPDVEGW